MNLLNTALSCSIACCGLLLASPVSGHGENTDLQINTLGSSMFLGDEFTPTIRLMGPHFGNTQIGDDRFTVNSPWVNFGPSINPATRQFSMHLQALRVWDGSGFVDPIDEILTIDHGNGTTILDNNLSDSFQLNPDDIEIDWTLSSLLAGQDPDRGVYLVELFIREDTPGSTVEDSQTLFLAFDFESGYTPENPSYLSAGYDHSTHAAAREYVTDNLLVPEPGSIALLGLGSLVLLRRQRRD